ncbi:hypothetical protein ABZX62_20400 [Streptomyces flavidovirens]|uniref:hypothetical protein n=1 Tax=Streptomyces flavidovirens TaxID=67298 RepID=UPI0033A653EB
MEWEQQAFYEASGGDRVSLMAMNDGHWAVHWAYAAPHSSAQLVSYDREQAIDVFFSARNQAENREGLKYDSRSAWQGGSV